MGVRVAAWWAAVGAVACGSARGEILVAEARATGQQASGWTPVLGSPVTVASVFYPPVSRGVYEYWMPTAPPQVQLTSFSFEFYLDYPIGLPVQMRAYFYRADGVIGPEDFVRTDLLIGMTPRLEFAERWYTLTVTNVAALNAELGGARRFGVLLTGVDGLATITADRVNVAWVPGPGAAVALAAGVGVVAGRKRRRG